MGWLEILVDKKTLSENLKLLKEKAKSARFYAVVKSNAYGHGIVECSRIFLESGANALAVSLVDEAEALRESGVRSDILLLGGFLPGQEEKVVDGGYEVAVSDFSMLRALGKEAERKKKPVKIHIKVDTGMGRLGFTEDQIKNVLWELERFSFLRLYGVMSHFPVADEESEDSKNFTKSQIKLFEYLIKKYKLEKVSCIHISNSAGLLFYPEALFSGVRVGIGLYGGIKFPGLSEAMTVRTKLLSVREVPKGWSISYGRTYRTERRKRIGIIPFGYALGYSRLLSNRAEVVVNGRRCKVLGRVCMDLTVIDLDGVEAKPSDWVYILGGEEERISVFELAEWCQTITYEIFCLLGKSPSGKLIYI